MKSSRLILNVDVLSGTCYFEFLPDEYRGSCWNNESVFLTEQDFSRIEPIFSRHYPDFDHYSFQSINRVGWQPIIDDLLVLPQSAHGKEVVETAEDLAHWLRNQLTQFETVTVLGM